MKRNNNTSEFPITTAKALQILIIISSIVFFQLLFNGFVYDDIEQIITNPAVHTLQAIPSFFTGSTFFDPVNGMTSGAFYRPVMSTFFAVMYSLFGTSAGMYHLIQILIHTMNACLLYVIGKKFLKTPTALFIACIFLMHPINQEVVAYVSDLQETLFFFFGMLGLVILTRESAGKYDIWLVPILMMLSLFSKETAVLFIVISIVVLLVKKTTYKREFLWGIGGAACIYVCMRIFFVHVSPITNAVVPIMRASLTERLLTVPSIIWYYLKTFIFPNRLALGEQWVVVNPTDMRFVWPLIVDVCVVSSMILVGLWLRKNRTLYQAFIFFALWFFLGVLLHSQLIPLDGTVADRWFYFPVVGILGMIGVLIDARKVNIAKWPSVAAVVAVLIILLLGARTIVRNTNWRDTYTLCSHDLTILQHAYNVESACGSEAFKRGNFLEAKSHYARTVALAPTWGLAWYQLGLSKEHTNDVNGAKADYQKSIALSHDANAYVSLAATYFKYDHDAEKAMQVLQEGMIYHPTYQRLQLYSAVGEEMLGHHETAVEIATKAWQQSPSPEAAYVMQQLLAKQEVKIE